MAVLVSGIGFVGVYVVRDLLGAGEDVVLYGLFGGGVDESTKPDLVYLDDLLGGVDVTGRVTVVVGDISNLPLLLDTIEKNDVRAAVHLASLISASSQADIPRAMRVN